MKCVYICFCPEAIELAEKLDLIQISYSHKEKALGVNRKAFMQLFPYDYYIGGGSGEAEGFRPPPTFVE